MTTATFKYIDPNSYVDSTVPFTKPWAKVDGPGRSFTLADRQKSVHDLRSASSTSTFNTDTSGFSVHHSPAKEKTFTDDAAVRTGYYAEVEQLLRKSLPGKVKKVTIFDHTIRRRVKDAPRQPVQQVHVDQTPSAAEARVRRHLPADEAEDLLKGRYQIVNVWRPIENAATDFPLAMVDWRSTRPEDFVRVDLLYPARQDSPTADDDDRGKEVLPDPTSLTSTAGYEIKGETYSVAPNESHKFYYVKGMTPDEAIFLKCFDSRGEGLPEGVRGLARGTPHTAFEDPQTPADAPGRQSIEVRCLVFYE